MKVRNGYWAIAAAIALIVGGAAAQAQTAGAACGANTGALVACGTAARGDRLPAYERWRNGDPAVGARVSDGYRFPLRGFGTVYDFGR